MKLVSLNVKELYGCYNYDVKFNSDVTFLYGSNGCGKTTILNITEAIITGQIYKLFNYKFETIKLYYAKTTNMYEVKSILITQKDSHMSIEFENASHNLNRLNQTDEFHSSERTPNIIKRSYFNRYSFLKEIQEIFNYVYLPLNRSIASYDYNELYELRRYHSRNYIEQENSLNTFSYDLNMLQIEHLIGNQCARINATIFKLNDTFRNNILKSLLKIHETKTITDVLNEIMTQRNAVSNLKHTRDTYISILKELDLVTATKAENYYNFFDTCIEEFINYQKSNFSGFPLDLVLKFQEISKIQNLIDIAEKTELRKTLVRKPIEIFLTTMNDFIGNTEDNKLIHISPMGKIYFTTKYNKQPININFLSSGEKQLITFFANLIFNVKDNSSGIFVVDEPELSLHLSWQKIFVEKTLEINPNIQLIFATHAPEIIGKNRNKMFRLEKHFIKENK